MISSDRELSLLYWVIWIILTFYKLQYQYHCILHCKWTSFWIRIYTKRISPEQLFLILLQLFTPLFCIDCHPAASYCHKLGLSKYQSSKEGVRGMDGQAEMFESTMGWSFDSRSIMKNTMVLCFISPSYTWIYRIWSTTVLYSTNKK